MEISVKVEKILEKQSFTSKKDGTVYNKYGFVGKTQEQYAKTICFVCMGDEAWGRMNIQVGSTYQVSFDVSSREWNGKYFTECSCWRAQLIGGFQQVKSAVHNAQPYVEPQANVSSGDPLPF